MFFAVPAEEYVEVEYRASLVKEGNLFFLGGKPERVRLGYFDDIDIAMMIHTTGETELKKAAVAESSNGCVVKIIRFIGRAARPGGAPHKGINALNAANLALAAVDLFWGDAEKAKEILVEYRPAMTKVEYLVFQKSLFRTELYHGETGQSELR